MNWIKQIQSNGTLQIEDNQLYFFVPPNTAAAQSMARWTTIVPVPDVKISYDQIWFEHNITSGPLLWETRFRWDINTNSYYAVQFNFSLNELSVIRVDFNTTITVLATVPYADWIPEISYHIEIFMRGNTIDVFVDGFQYISNVQDNGLTSGGYVGIGVKNVQTQNYVGTLNPTSLISGNVSPDPGPGNTGNNIVNLNGLYNVDSTLTTFNCFSPGSKSVTAFFDPTLLSLDPNKNLYFNIILSNIVKSNSNPVYIDNLLFRVNGFLSNNVSNNTVLSNSGSYSFGGQNDLYWGLAEIITGQDLILNSYMYSTLHYNSPLGNQLTQDGFSIQVGYPNGVRWDNFEVDFTSLYAVEVSGTYEKIGISIPFSGNFHVSGSAKLGFTQIATGGITISDKTRIGRGYLTTGSIETSGSGLYPREYRGYGIIDIGGNTKIGIGFIPSGGIITSGSPYLGISLKSSGGISIDGEPLLRTTGIIDFNWVNYLPGVIAIDGNAICRIVTSNFRYIGSQTQIVTSGTAITGVGFIGGKVTNLLIGDWNFNEGSGNTTTDSHGYVGTLTNMPSNWSTDLPSVLKNNTYSLLFNNSNPSSPNPQYVAFDGTTSNKFDVGTNDFSVSCWIKPNSTQNFDFTIAVSKLDTTGDVLGWGIGTSGSTSPIGAFSIINWNTPSGPILLTSTFAIDDGNWHHLLITKDSTYFRFYADSMLQAETDHTSLSSNNTISLNNSGALCFGTDGVFFQSALNYQGNLDGVRIYNKKLTQEEIVEIYQGYYPVTTSLGTIPINGSYIFGGINYVSGGEVLLSGTSLTSNGYGGSGLVFVSGTGLYEYQRRDVIASSTIIGVGGSAIVISNRYQYIPDLSLEIIRTLDGNQIKPYSVPSYAIGTFRGILKNSRLYYNLEFSLPTSTATSIKLYRGDINNNGDLFIDLTPYLPNLLSPAIGEVILTNQVMQEFIQGAIYVVICTDSYPDGEIRGQLIPTPLVVSSSNFTAIVAKGQWEYVPTTGITMGGEVLGPSIEISRYIYTMSREFSFVNDLTQDQVIPPSLSNYQGTINLTLDKKLYDFYYANLTGSQVIPSSSSTATGFTLLNYDNENRILSWTITHNAVNVTEISINAPASIGVNGPLVIDIPYFSDNNTNSPIIGSCPLTPSQYNVLLSGAYVLIKTTQNPSGDIRGQLIFNSTEMACDLIIVHNVPPSQINSIKLYSPKKDGFFALSSVNLTALTTSLESPIQFIKFPMTIELATEILNGKSYIQINTLNNPDGELRCDLKLTNGSLVANGEAFINNVVIATGYLSVQGQGYIGRRQIASGGILIGGTFARAYTFICSDGITLSGNAIADYSIFSNGGITVDGSAKIGRGYFVGNDNIALSGEAVTDKIYYGAGIISVNGSASVNTINWKYVGVGGALCDGNQLIKTNWKYVPSGGIDISDLNLLVNIYKPTVGGTISISGNAIYQSKHYIYEMTSGVSISGTSLVNYKEYFYIASSGLEIGGIATVYIIKFPSNISKGGVIRLLNKEEKDTSIEPTRKEIDSIYCEYNEENQNEKICKNGAWISSKLRKNQKNYLPKN